MSVVVHRDLGLAHCFQQATLSFWRRAVDLVGEHNIGKQRSRHELKSLFLAIEDGDADNIRGEQVARELDAFKGAIERAGEAVGQRGLADAGHVFN